MWMYGLTLKRRLKRKLRVLFLAYLIPFRLPCPGYHMVLKSHLNKKTMTDRSNFLISSWGWIDTSPAHFLINKGINMYYQISSLLVCSFSTMLTGYHFLFGNSWLGLAFISVISCFMVWDSREGNY